MQAYGNGARATLPRHALPIGTAAGTRSEPRVSRMLPLKENSHRDRVTVAVVPGDARIDAQSLYSTVMKYSAPAGLYLLMSAYGHHFSEAWRQGFLSSTLTAARLKESASVAR